MEKLKSINDTFDHHIGDETLLDCAMILKNSICKGDTLARIGGDEFVIVMPTVKQARRGKEDNGYNDTG